MIESVAAVASPLIPQRPIAQYLSIIIISACPRNLSTSGPPTEHSYHAVAPAAMYLLPWLSAHLPAAHSLHLRLPALLLGIPLL